MDIFRIITFAFTDAISASYYFYTRKLQKFICYLSVLRLTHYLAWTRPSVPININAFVYIYCLIWRGGFACIFIVLKMLGYSTQLSIHAKILIFLIAKKAFLSCVHTGLICWTAFATCHVMWTLSFKYMQMNSYWAHTVLMQLQTCKWPYSGLYTINFFCSFMKVLLNSLWNVSIATFLYC